MTREAGVAYKSRKYELCSLKAECTNLAKEFSSPVPQFSYSNTIAMLV